MKSTLLCAALAILAVVVMGLAGGVWSQPPATLADIEPGCLDPNDPLPPGAAPVVRLGDRDGAEWKAVITADIAGLWAIWMPVQGLGVCMIAAGDEMEISQ